MHLRKALRSHQGHQGRESLGQLGVESLSVSLTVNMNASYLPLLPRGLFKESKWMIILETIAQGTAFSVTLCVISFAVMYNSHPSQDLDGICVPFMLGVCVSSRDLQLYTNLLLC